MTHVTTYGMMNNHATASRSLISNLVSKNEAAVKKEKESDIVNFLNRMLKKKESVESFRNSVAHLLKDGNIYSDDTMIDHAIHVSAFVIQMVREMTSSSSGVLSALLDELSSFKHDCRIRNRIFVAFDVAIMNVKPFAIDVLLDWLATADDGSNDIQTRVADSFERCLVMQDCPELSRVFVRRGLVPSMRILEKNGPSPINVNVCQEAGCFGNPRLAQRIAAMQTEGDLHLLA